MERYIAYIGLLLCIYLNACSYSTKQTKSVLSDADMIRIAYNWNFGDQGFDFYIFHNDSMLRDFAKNLKLSYDLLLIDTITFRGVQQYLFDNPMYTPIEEGAPAAKEYCAVIIASSNTKEVVSQIETKQYILEYVGELKKYFATIENEQDRKQLTEMCDYIYKDSKYW